MTPKKYLKMIKLIEIGAFELKQISDNMVLRCMPNSGHGGLPGIRVMTNLGSYVGRHFANIQYFDVCGGI